MKKSTDSNATTPSHLSHQKLTALLGLPNIGALFALRAQCIRDGTPFPEPGPGGFLQCDAIAFKNVLAARTATQTGNTQPTNLPRDRRANIDRRAL